MPKFRKSKKRQKQDAFYARVSKAPKKKRSEKSRLKDKALAELSKAIRLEANAKSKDGRIECVTCGHRSEWNRGMQMGHFIDGRRNCVCLDESNVAIQCYACNVILNGKKDVFYKWMLEHRGQEVIDNLQRRNNTKSVSFSEEFLRMKIAQYRERQKKASSKIEKVLI